MDHYKNAPQLLRGKIEILLEKLEVAITQESMVAFAKIISKNPKLHIYSLGLFYNSTSWDSIVPTFASEEGLQYIAENYAFDSITKFKNVKTTLRWSASDSPHHDDDTFLTMMPTTELLLQKISATLDDADPMYKQYEWPEAYLGDYSLFYGFLSHVYQSIQNAVILGLKSVWKNTTLRDFFLSNHCALTLSSESITNEDFLNHIKKLNTEIIYNKLEAELEKAQQIEYQNPSHYLNHDFL